MSHDTQRHEKLIHQGRDTTQHKKETKLATATIQVVLRDPPVAPLNMSLFAMVAYALWLRHVFSIAMPTPQPTPAPTPTPLPALPPSSFPTSPPTCVDGTLSIDIQSRALRKHGYRMNSEHSQRPTKTPKCGHACPGRPVFWEGRCRRRFHQHGTLHPCPCILLFRCVGQGVDTGLGHDRTLPLC